MATWLDFLRGGCPKRYRRRRDQHHRRRTRRKIGLVRIANLPSRLLRHQSKSHPQMVRHEHVRESSEEGALQCQQSQKRQISKVIVTLGTSSPSRLRHICRFECTPTAPLKLSSSARPTSPRPPAPSGSYPNEPPGSLVSPTSLTFRELEAALSWSSPLSAIGAAAAGPGVRRWLSTGQPRGNTGSIIL
jgi:hypothetical protein